MEDERLALLQVRKNHESFSSCLEARFLLLKTAGDFEKPMLPTACSQDLALQAKLLKRSTKQHQEHVPEQLAPEEYQWQQRTLSGLRSTSTGFTVANVLAHMPSSPVSPDQSFGPGQEVVEGGSGELEASDVPVTHVSDGSRRVRHTGVHETWLGRRDEWTCHKEFGPDIVADCASRYPTSGNKDSEGRRKNLDVSETPVAHAAGVSKKRSSVDGGRHASKATLGVDVLPEGHNEKASLSADGSTTPRNFDTEALVGVTDDATIRMAANVVFDTADIAIGAEVCANRSVDTAIGLNCSLRVSDMPAGERWKPKTRRLVAVMQRCQVHPVRDPAAVYRECQHELKEWKELWHGWRPPSKGAASQPSLESRGRSEKLHLSYVGNRLILITTQPSNQDASMRSSQQWRGWGHKLHLKYAGHRLVLDNLGSSPPKEVNGQTADELEGN
jgi:hypothetical protein